MAFSAYFIGPIFKVFSHIFILFIRLGWGDPLEMMRIKWLLYYSFVSFSLFFRKFSFFHSFHPYFISCKSFYSAYWKYMHMGTLFFVNEDETHHHHVTLYHIDDLCPNILLSVWVNDIILFVLMTMSVERKLISSSRLIDSCRWYT